MGRKMPGQMASPAQALAESAPRLDPEGGVRAADPHVALYRLLDRLCPLHLCVAQDGRVLHAGPTLAKLRAGTVLQGQALCDLFQITRPRKITSAAELFDRPASPLRLSFRAPPQTPFKGHVAVYGDMAVINLSFGISVLDAVRDYRLSSGDFAPTDMTIEMLYVIEAKSAAMEESRKLNQRLRGAMVAAEEQALTDTLTGLANRRALDLRLAEMQRIRDGFALMHLDLDHFKQVNDTFGHAAGDHVLIHVAAILSAEVRRGDTVARIGGDEFVLLLPALQDRAALQAIAERIIARVLMPVRFADQICHVGCSIGIVHSGSYDQPDPALMIADADAALYRAKRRGRACHSFANDDD